MARKKKLCVIITSALSLKLFRNQWKYWQDCGWEITAVCGPGEQEHRIINDLGVQTFVMPFERTPSPIKDFLALVRLWWFLLWHRFDVLHISTPKASFLGALAGRLTFHNRIYYLLRGRAYENMTGVKRKLMCACEWITCHLSTIVVPICKEMGQVVIDEGLCPAGRVEYVGSGSSAGIDLAKFTKTEAISHKAKQLRNEHSISDSDIVLIFVGWFRRDKGINELVSAFKYLLNKYSNIKLILLGEFEDSDPLEPETVSEIENNNAIIHINWQKEPAVYYAMADILVFPTYREGFGNIAIEASAMELPVVASDITGCREAVLDNYSGILVEMQNIQELSKAIEKLIIQPELRSQYGIFGRKRVEAEFSEEIIFNETQKKLDKLLLKR